MISNQKEVLDIVSEFLNEKKVVEIIDLHRGHINDSYIIKMPNYQYILQRINTNVFTRPYGMMNNIYKVTKHIKRQVTYDGDNPQRAVLNLVRTQYGELLCIGIMPIGEWLSLLVTLSLMKTSQQKKYSMKWVKLSESFKNF